VTEVTAPPSATRTAFSMPDMSAIVCTHSLQRCNNKAVVDSRRRPPPVSNLQLVLPVFIVEQNLGGIWAIMLLMFYRCLGIRRTRRRTGPLCESVMSSTNRKYITYCNAIKGGPSQGHRQRAQNVVKFGLVVFQLYERTDKQTNKETDKQTYSSRYVAPLPEGGG